MYREHRTLTPTFITSNHVEMFGEVLMSLVVFPRVPDILPSLPLPATVNTPRIHLPQKCKHLFSTFTDSEDASHAHQLPTPSSHSALPWIYPKHLYQLSLASFTATNQVIA